MDYLIFLAYIVLAFIVVITIQILFKIFYPDKEKFTNIESFNNNNDNNNDNYLNYEDIKWSIPTNLMAEESNQTINNNDSCNLTPQLINSNTCINYEINDEQINSKEFRNNFLDFRSHLYQSSNDIDPVDKINDKIYTGDGSYDIPKCGEKISSTYDYLTGSNNCNENYKPDNIMNSTSLYDNVSASDPFMNEQMILD